MRRILLACAVVVPVLLAGCTPTPQPAPNTPAPTIVAPTMQLMCTPEEGGPAAPCTQAEYDAMVERDKLYDEAKSVLNQYNAEFERLAREGAPASEEILNYTAGDFTQFTKDEFSHGFEFEGGEFKTVWVKRLMGDSRGGSILALKTCTDTTSITVKQGTKVVGKGRKAEESYFFGNTPRGLAIVAAQNVEVSTC